MLMSSTCGYEDTWTSFLLAWLRVIHKAKGMWNVGHWKTSTLQARAEFALGVLKVVIIWRTEDNSSRVTNRRASIHCHVICTRTVLQQQPPPSTHIKKHWYTHLMQAPNQKLCRQPALPYKGHCSMHAARQQMKRKDPQRRDVTGGQRVATRKKSEVEESNFMLIDGELSWFHICCEFSPFVTFQPHYLNETHRPRPRTRFSSHVTSSVFSHTIRAQVCSCFVASWQTCLI